jgi:hypothetical protein
VTRALSAGLRQPWFARSRLVPLPCRGLVLGSRRYLLGLAHRKRARLGNARGDPSLWRAGATSMVGKDFLAAVAPKSPLLGRAMGVLRIARRCNCAADLPDVSKCFRRTRSKHPCQRPPATLHRVVFDISVGSAARSAIARWAPARQPSLRNGFGSCPSSLSPCSSYAGHHASP